MILSVRVRFMAAVLALGLALPGFAVLAQEATPLAEAQATPTDPGMELPLPEWAEVVATGLANPRGMAFAADGTLYVAEAGVGGEGPCAMGPEGNEECFGASGGVTRVSGSAQERVLDGLASRAAAGGMNATGPNDVSVAGDTLYVLIGFGGDPASRVDLGTGDDQFGYLLRADDGGPTPVVDVAGYETANNPDKGPLDANPFALEMTDGEGVIVDAGMNALLRLGEGGTLSTLAVFPDEMAKAPDGAEIPMNAVPIGVAIADDGSYFVGQLTGVPFPPGGARVFKVPAGGGDPTVVYEGFTNIIDIALAPDGSLYVLEFNRGGILNINPANPATLEGQLTRIAPDGERSVYASEGLIAPTGLAVDSDGNPYVAVYGVLGNMGQVWKILGA
jgi:hypothetical protein